MCNKELINFTFTFPRAVKIKLGARDQTAPIHHKPVTAFTAYIHWHKYESFLIWKSFWDVQFNSTRKWKEFLLIVRFVCCRKFKFVCVRNRFPVKCRMRLMLPMTRWCLALGSGEGSAPGVCLPTFSLNSFSLHWSFFDSGPRSI